MSLVSFTPESIQLLTFSGLFNLRGSDIPYNPVFFAYALVTLDNVTLYIDKSRLTEDSVKYLKDVTIKGYADIFTDLAVLQESLESQNSKLGIDLRCNLALEEALGGPAFVKQLRSPVMLAKSIKNATEMEGFRQSHLRDASALVRLL